MNKLIFIFSLTIFLENYLYSEDIKEEFVKKGWEYGLKQIKTAKVSYEIKSSNIKGVRKCLWQYKDRKERLDVEFLDENGEIEKKVCYIGKEMKTIIFSYENNNSIKGVSILPGYAYFSTYLTPSTALFDIPSFIFPIEELIKKSYIAEITSSYAKLEYTLFAGKDKISWEIFLSLKHFLPEKIIVRCSANMSTYIIDYIEMDKILFPKKIRQIIKWEDGKLLDSTITYQYIEVNKEISDEIFMPEFPKGTMVSDMTTGITYEIK
ncbi:MAG: hypothetical protein NC926_07125 [Candidatus Omnitrophica bacterium]|nr:hypothetical protein [Candidatus Omnitrophota bacterium]